MSLLVASCWLGQTHLLYYGINYVRTSFYLPWKSYVSQSMRYIIQS